MNEDRIFGMLERIKEDLSSAREDLSFMKAKGEEHSRRLNGLERKVDDMAKKLSALENGFAVHKAKMAAFGAAGGATVGGIIAAIKAMFP